MKMIRISHGRGGLVRFLRPANMGSRLWLKRFLSLVGLVAIAMVPVIRAGTVDRTTFYVGTNGNDAWSGRFPNANAAKTDGPFATIERARDEIRVLKGGAGLPKEGAVVEILGGRYELMRPIDLTSMDSGTAEAPVIYRARTGDVVRISGGRNIDGWKPVTDPGTLERLDASARGKIFQANLAAQGITEYGDLGLDAAWELQVWLAKTDNQGEDAMGSAYASVGKNVSPRLEVFFNGEPMEISRWPNEGFIRIEEVLGASPIEVRGVKGCKEGIFVYEGDRPKRWMGEKDAWVQGYWFRDWAEQRHKIASIDAGKKIISVIPPYHNYGYRKGQWFRGFNLLNEIDEPGEWYIDRSLGIVYFWPPRPIDRGSVEVSMAPGLFRLVGASHVTIRGLLMEAARGTAISIAAGERCRVIGCTFRNLGNHAVTVFNGEGHGVIGCDMQGMGGGGIYLVGGDRKALAPAAHFAENNHIHHFGRWDRMYRPGLFLSGVGLRASHNLIHDAPHAAILFGGNDHIFEYNEIHNVCTESHDCGAIYAGRSWTLRGHVIQYNYLHHLCGKDGGPCNGIYLDDLFSSATVRGNVFYQVLRPVFIGGGRDNVIENNVFVDCPKAIHIDARALGWCGPHADGRIKEAQEKGTIAGVRYKEPPFSTRYPQLVNLLDDEPKKPKGNIVRRNIFWQGPGEDLRRVAAGESVKETWWDDIDPKIRSLVRIENNLINEDPGCVDAQAGNFRLRDDSPAWRLGFQRIPFEKIGLYQDGARASWPASHPVRPLPRPAIR
ncbi:MAG TPA: right-handed parallel beta-helix repeat-containing protein [Verrucomicrobiae bacterium]|nr:right-handed parallel beta-helix repeat-containing protein [Verrucomicrobiae bacterium]